LTDMLTQQLSKTLPKTPATPATDAVNDTKPMAMPTHWRQRTGDEQ